MIVTADSVLDLALTEDLKDLASSGDVRSVVERLRPLSVYADLFRDWGRKSSGVWSSVPHLLVSIGAITPYAYLNSSYFSRMYPAGCLSDWDLLDAVNAEQADIVGRLPALLPDLGDDALDEEDVVDLMNGLEDAFFHMEPRICSEVLHCYPPCIVGIKEGYRKLREMTAERSVAAAVAKYFDRDFWIREVSTFSTSPTVWRLVRDGFHVQYNLDLLTLFPRIQEVVITAFIQLCQLKVLELLVQVGEDLGQLVTYDDLMKTDKFMSLDYVSQV